MAIYELVRLSNYEWPFETRNLAPDLRAYVNMESFRMLPTPTDKLHQEVFGEVSYDSSLKDDRYPGSGYPGSGYHHIERLCFRGLYEWYKDSYISRKSYNTSLLGYQDDDCCILAMEMIPRVYAGRHDELYDGLVYTHDKIKDILKVSRLTLATQCDRGGIQMIVETRPAKRDTRRLQGLLLPLIVPLNDTKEIFMEKEDQPIHVKVKNDWRNLFYHFIKKDN